MSKAKKPKDILISQATSKESSLRDADEDKDVQFIVEDVGGYDKQHTFRSQHRDNLSIAKHSIRSLSKTGSNRSASMYQLGLAGQLTDRSGR